MKEKCKRSKITAPLWVMVLISVLVGVLIVVIFLYCPKNEQLAKFAEALINIERKCSDILSQESAGVFAAQTSLTFISISVLSVLSDKDHIIYWKNIIESHLVEPPFMCFAAYTTYSITTIGISLFGLIFKNYSLICMGFLLDIVVLVFLTKSMLDIYFARTRLKQRLEKEFVNATEEEKADICEKLYEYITKAIESNDFTYLKETFQFIIKNKELFGNSYKSLIGSFAEADKAAVQFFAKWYFENDYNDLFIRRIGDAVSLEYNDVFWNGYVRFCKKEYANADFICDTRLQNLADLFIKRVLNFYNAVITVLDEPELKNGYLIDIKKWDEQKILVTNQGKTLSPESANQKLDCVLFDAIWGDHNDVNAANTAWSFVYSTIKALVEIFGERIECEFEKNKIIEKRHKEENERAAAERRKPQLTGEETIQEQFGFNTIFKNLPFYKVLASDRFMSSDAFQEHHEFMDFLRDEIK